MELPDRDALELDFSRKLGTLWAAQRRELTQLLGDPPDPAQIPQEWWDRARRDNDGALALMLYLVLTKSAIGHLDLINRGDRIHSAIASEDRTNQIMQSLEPKLNDIARQRAAEVASKLEARNKEMLAKAAENEVLATRAGIRETTVRLFGPSRVAGTVTTSTTFGRAMGGETVVAQSVGFSHNDKWFTVYGSGIVDGKVCPVCEALNDSGRGYWSRFFLMGPPAHESCRCEIQFAFEAAALAGGASR